MLCLCAAQLKFWIKLTSDAKIQAVITGREEVAFNFPPWSRIGHALCPIFMFLYWSKFDRWVHAENLCSIFKLVYFDSWSWQSLCQLVMFLTVFFHWMYKMKYSCYQESSVIHGWFVYWVLVEKCVGCQSRKSDFGWHRFCFSPCLMRKMA